VGRLIWVIAIIAASTGLSVLVGCEAAPEHEPAMRLPDHFRTTETLTAHAMVTVLLRQWHRAAARGDFDGYFGRMTDDAVFLGTDANERWTRAEFEAFARPYFDGVEAWTYEQVETHLAVGPVDRAGDDPDTVWIDEVLWNDKYGSCRGTGLARREDDGWRLQRYSLSFLIPNDRAAAVMEAVGPQTPPAGVDTDRD
jgi:hypothetical protein